VQLWGVYSAEYFEAVEMQVLRGGDPMMDILVQKDRKSIKSKLKGQFSGRFCYFSDFNGVPEQTNEGCRILFSDGENVIGESVILDVSSSEIRFEPLTPVRKPNPESPPGTGYKYVDAGDCGKYSIDFHGVEHVYETFHDLMKAVLKNRPKARNSEDVLLHTIWTDVEGRDLNDREEFCQRFERGTVLRIRDEVQLDRLQYPPTDPDVLEKRYSQSTKAYRVFGSLEGFVDDVMEFYRERGEARSVEDLDELVTDSGERTLEGRKQLVREAAVGRDLEAEFRGESSA